MPIRIANTYMPKILMTYTPISVLYIGLFVSPAPCNATAKIKLTVSASYVPRQLLFTRLATTNFAREVIHVDECYRMPLQTVHFAVSTWVRGETAYWMASPNVALVVPERID